MTAEKSNRCGSLLAPQWANLDEPGSYPSWWLDGHYWLTLFLAPQWLISPWRAWIVWHMNVSVLPWLSPTVKPSWQCLGAIWNPFPDYYPPNQTCFVSRTVCYCLFMREMSSPPSIQSSSLQWLLLQQSRHSTPSTQHCLARWWCQIGWMERVPYAVTFNYKLSCSVLWDVVLMLCATTNQGGG